MRGEFVSCQQLARGDRSNHLKMGSLANAGCGASTRREITVDWGVILAAWRGSWGSLPMVPTATMHRWSQNPFVESLETRRIAGKEAFVPLASGRT